MPKSQMPPCVYESDDGPTREQAKQATKEDAVRKRIRKAAHAAGLKFGVSIDESVECCEDSCCVTISIWDAGDVETIFKALKILGGA